MSLIETNTQENIDAHLVWTSGHLRPTAALTIEDVQFIRPKKTRSISDPPKAPETVRPEDLSFLMEWASHRPFVKVLSSRKRWSMKCQSSL